ncbi:MAG: 2-oxo acid dehydrogenase subunit E2, partial [Chloroflexi bacterium]|nr:2-oxo acid dehydrogenase subunit E2 [Chloroflexota bacterium]
VAEWYVPDGGEVRAGQVLYRMETEKIELEVEAEAPGFVRHVVAAGTKLEPGKLIAYILAAGEAPPAGLAPSPVSPPVAAAGAGSRTAGAAGGPVGDRPFASPIARRLARESGVPIAAVAGTGPGGRITESDVLAYKPSPTARPAAASAVERPRPVEVIASPLARKLAEQLRVDLARVRGTGPGGRITKEDVEGAASSPPAVPRAAPALQPQGRHNAGDIIPVRGMRKVIAERMHASLQDMAQLTMAMEVVMDDAVKLRSQLVAEWAPEGIKPSYTDLVIKAVGKALRRHPLLNATMKGAEIELLEQVNVGMAVALDDGLVVPVIRDAADIPLKDVAETSSRLASAAREGRLGLDEMADGTFSVTSLGMAGVDFFTPVINPPNVAILGVGRIRDAVAWDGDRPVKQQQMTLSLTIDHRVVDGAPGAAFLNTVRELLESPYRLLL